MEFNEAVRKRINELVKETGLSLSALSTNSILTPSIIYDFLSGRTKSLNAFTIKKICYGAGITLKVFYSIDYFDDFDDVVK